MEDKNKLFKDIIKNELEFSETVLDIVGKYIAHNLSAEEAMSEIAKNGMLYELKKRSHCSRIDKVMDEDED